MSEGIINDFLEDAGDRMHKSVDSTRHEFGTVRTGRASPALLDRVEVDYYGTRTPLKQLAGISATEARLLTVTPYDKSSIKAIELTEERRKELVKVVRRIAEDGRVAIRNVRRDVMHDLRELKGEGEVGKDDEHRAEVELQKLTDTRIGELDSALSAKEKEILEI